jgi:hypothetical protein
MGSVKNNPLEKKNHKKLEKKMFYKILRASSSL